MAKEIYSNCIHFYVCSLNNDLILLLTATAEPSAAPTITLDSVPEQNTSSVLRSSAPLSRSHNTANTPT